jgi:hypothetical protein
MHPKIKQPFREEGLFYLEKLKIKEHVIGWLKLYNEIIDILKIRESPNYNALTMTDKLRSLTKE